MEPIAADVRRALADATGAKRSFSGQHDFKLAPTVADGGHRDHTSCTSWTQMPRAEDLPVG